MIGLGVGIDYGLFIVTPPPRPAPRRDGAARVDRPHDRDLRRRGAVRREHGHHRAALARGRRHPARDHARLHLGDRRPHRRAGRDRRCCRPSSALLGPRVNALPLPGLRTHHDERPHGWQRWARLVADHPWPALVVGVLVLARARRAAAPPPPRADRTSARCPTDTQARQAYDRMTARLRRRLQRPDADRRRPDASRPQNDQKQLDSVKQQQSDAQAQQQQAADAAAEAQGAARRAAAGQQQVRQQTASSRPQAAAAGAVPGLHRLRPAAADAAHRPAEDQAT